MANLNIDRLEIRLKGIPPETARPSVAELGRELLAQLAKQQGVVGQRRAINISKIDAGTVQIDKHASPSDVRGRVSGRIVQGIAAKAKSER